MRRMGVVLATRPHTTSIRPRAFDFDTTCLPLSAPRPRRGGGALSPHRGGAFVRNRKQTLQDPLKEQINQINRGIERSKQLSRSLRSSTSPSSFEAYFSQEGVEMSTYHCTLLIHLQRVRGDTDSCLETLHRMKREGITPDTFTYAAVLSSLAIRSYTSMTPNRDDLLQQKSLSSKADVVWEEAMSSSVAGSGSTEEDGAMLQGLYGAMLKVCAAGADPARARHLLSEIDRRQITVNSVHVERGVLACARNSQLSLAWDTFLSFRHLLPVPSKALYTRAIQVAGRLRRVPEALLLFREMSEVGHSIGTREFNVMMKAAASSEDGRSLVVELFEDMMAMRGGGRPNAHTLTIVMIVCARRGDLDLALQLLTHIQRVRPQAHVLEALFQQFLCCLARSQWVSPEPLALTRSSSNRRTLTRSDRARLAEEVVQTMQSKYSLPLTSRTLNALLSVYSQGAMSSGALQVLQSYSSHSLRPDLLTYKSLLLPHVKAVVAAPPDDLRLLRASPAWAPDCQTREELRRWARAAAPRQAGIDAVEIALRDDRQ